MWVEGLKERGRIIVNRFALWMVAGIKDIIN